LEQASATIGADLGLATGTVSSALEALNASLEREHQVLLSKDIPLRAGIHILTNK